MNSGAITSRYARALLLYSMECGAGEKVYAQASALLKVMEQVPKLKLALQSSGEHPFDKRVELVDSALSEKSDPVLVRFMKLLDDNGRTEFIDRILLAFVRAYRRQNNIKVGHLVVACDSGSLREKMERDFSARTGSDVIIETEVNPEIIGGFILDIDGKRIDASVSGQLKKLRKALIDNNKRII